MRAVAVHEFGHALGFAHEQNRSDTPASCTAQKQGTNGDITFGAWDGNSVMNYCNGNGLPVNDGNLTPTDIQGFQQYYGPFKVSCNGQDSTCQDVNFDRLPDINAITGSYPASTQYAENGSGASFNTKADITPHSTWQIKFISSKGMELPTDSVWDDFTNFNPSQNTGCIAFDSTSQKDSIGQRDLVHGTCSPLGYGATRYPRYVSTHYNRDSTGHNAQTAWQAFPTDNQPITMQAFSGGTVVYIDVLQIRVKYGSIDVYSDTTTGNGVVAATPTISALGPGTHNVQIWSATKLIFAAHNSGNQVRSGFAPAALDGVIIGEP